MDIPVELLKRTTIEWTHSGDGEFPYLADHDGTRLTIRINDFPSEPLYSLIVDGTEIATLEDWPPAWVKPDIPSRLLAAARQTRLVQEANFLQTLRGWARSLCDTIADDVHGTVTALGIPGDVVEQWTDHYEIAPPPPGSTRIVVAVDDDGAFLRLTVTLADVPITLADLTDEFGPGSLAPRVHAGRPYVTGYDCVVQGAMFRCRLHATTTHVGGPPTEASTVDEITLRREARPPELHLRIGERDDR